MWFIAQNMVYLDKCFMWTWTWEECMVSFCWMKYSIVVTYVHRCHLDPGDWWFCSVQLCLFWFSACWVCQLLTGLLNFPTTIVDSSVSPWSSIIFCFMHLNALLLVANTLRIVMFCWRIDLYPYVMLLFIPENFPCSEVCFVWNQYSHWSFLLVNIDTVYISSSLCLKRLLLKNV